MNRPSIWRAYLGLGLLGLSLVGPVPAEEPGQAVDRQTPVEDVKPRWRVGDRWVVETRTLLLQATPEKQGIARGKPIRWRFHVERIEKIAGVECYRVEVRCLEEGPRQPATTLWADRRSLAPRQLQTQLPVAGGFATVAESYRFPGGQPAPVQSPFTALPLDMPVFLGHVKGAQTYSYEAVVGYAGEKALGDVGFAFDVQQNVAQLEPAQVKGLIHDAFAKDLRSRPVTEVRLKSSQREVRQLWQSGRPWPSYSDNGTTEARLINVTPASPQPNDQREVSR